MVSKETIRRLFDEVAKVAISTSHLIFQEMKKFGGTLTVNCIYDTRSLFSYPVCF